VANGLALLIGVNQVDPAGYGGTWDGKLNFCEKDARAVAEITAGQGFSNTLLLTDQATKAAVREAIGHAAATLRDGDIFAVYYSGHGNTTGDITGDESDRGNMRDETLCLYDTQILDDEFYTLWQRFRPGVRVLVLTDACHSGSILRGAEDDLTPKAMDEVASKVLKRRNPNLYADMRSKLPPAQPVAASVLQLAGCREDQLSYESRSKQHGQFTAALLGAWSAAAADGGFTGNYETLFNAMHDLMPAKQKPVMNRLGVEDQRFNTEPVFTIA
jgi:uncharacterized caspase-like protein